MANSYKKELELIKAEIKAIVAQMELWDKAILENADKAISGGKRYYADLKSTNNILKEHSTLIKGVSEAITQQTISTEKLAAKKKIYNGFVEVGIQKEKARRQMIKMNVAASTNYAGAYAKLIAQQKLAKKSLHDLIAADKRNVTQIKKAQKEYDKLTKRVNRAKKATSNFAKNGLGGAIRGFKGLLGAFGVAGGLYLFANITKQVFALTKKLQSLDFALKTITADSNDLTAASSELYAAQEFLLDISTRYGLNILTTTERFTKFLAAAKQSNITFAETTRIFESVSKASAVLGLRTDELNGVYLALEQMISKGKVTTEELRRQLGERLPGAFGIMAEAMGYTVAEFDKMLKKGKILSAEALPKFATALEKAYGIESVNRVDTLVAAQNRLEVAWISFVRSVEAGENRISGVFSFLLEEINYAVVWWENMLTSDAWQRQKAISKTTAENFKVGANFAKQITQNLSVANSEKILNQMIATQKRQVETFEKSIQQIRDFANGDELSDAALEQITEYEIQMAASKGTMDGYRETLNAILNPTEVTITDDIKKTLIALKGSEGYLKKAISDLEEKRLKLAQTSEAYAEYTRQIEQAKNALKTLQDQNEVIRRSAEKVELEGVKKGDKGLGLANVRKHTKHNSPLIDSEGKPYGESILVGEEILGDEFEDMLDNAKNVMEDFYDKWQKNIEDTAELEKISADARIAIFKTLTDAFGEYYDVDFSKFEFLMDGKENKTIEWAQMAQETGHAILDGTLKRYEVELQEAVRTRDLILNNELATDEQKRLARERFEQKEAQIKTKRAKAERRNTLIKIAIDTAAAIAAAFAPPPLGYGPLAAPVFLPVLIGIGAAQAALVAAQPLPKFAEGHLAGTYEGAALINDASRSNYKEIVERKKGGVEVYSDRNQVIGMEKGDKVHKSMESFLSKYNLNDVFAMNVMADGRQLSQAQMLENSIFSAAIDKMGDKFDRTAAEMKQLARRPVSVNNRVVVEQPYSKYE